MDRIITQLVEVFNLMKTKPEHQVELDETLKIILNKLYPNGKCLYIFHSEHNNDDPFIGLVIPDIVNIMQEPKLMTHKYCVDLDMNMLKKPLALNGVTGEEMAAWIIHEFLHNIMTNTTKIRMEILLNNFIDASSDTQAFSMYESEFNLDTIRLTYFWLSIFSRTLKEVITDTNTEYEADKGILQFGLKNAWNSVLNKYVYERGYSYNIISEDYCKMLDEEALIQFNKMIREESQSIQRHTLSRTGSTSDRIKKYVINQIKSDLIQYFIKHIQTPYDKMNIDNINIYSQINDNNMESVKSHDHTDISASMSLHETVSIPDETEIKNNIKYNDLLKQIDRIGFEMEDIRTVDDKIAIMYKIRSLMKTVGNAIKRDPTNDLLKTEYEKLEVFLENLKTYKIPEKSYGVWIKDVPAGYEG